MNKKIVLAVVLVLLVVGFFVFGQKSSENKISEDKIKIGFVIQLTGEWGHLGKDVQDMILATHKKMPNKDSYELIFEDYGFDPKKAAMAANKLINIDKVDAVISLFSNAGFVVGPIAEKSKTPHICIDNVKAVADGEYNFVHGAMEEKVTALLANEIKSKGNDSATIFIMKDPWTENLIKPLVPNLEKAGVELLDVFRYNPSEKDFRMMISKSMAKNPDTYILMTFEPTMSVLIKQFRERGVENDKFTGFESIQMTDNLNLVEGIWFVNMVMPEEEFMNYMKQEIGRRPNAFSVYAYNAFLLLDEAYKTNNYDKDILDVLNGLSFDSSVGIMEVRDGGIIEIGNTVDVMKDGKAQIIHN